MSLVLAIEPDRAQADLLREVHAAVGVELLVVSSKDEAIDAIEQQVPDLVLVNALLSPREEDELVAHLRTLDHASHLQLLTTPRLGRTEAPAPQRKSLFGLGKKKAATPPSEGCDPGMFAEQVTQYLARAREIKSRPKSRVPLRPAVRVPAPAPVYDTPVFEPPAAAALTYETPTYQAPAYDTPTYETPVYEPPPYQAPAPAYDTPVYEPAAAYEPPPAITPPVDPEPLIRPAGDDAAAGEVDRLIERLGFGPGTVDNGPQLVDLSEPPPAPDRALDNEILIDLDLDLDLTIDPSPSAPIVDMPLATADRGPRSAGSENQLVDLRAAAETTLAAELERVQVEAAQQRERELAQWQVETEALREATVGRARAEAEAEAREALAAELARSRAEAAHAHEEEIARLQAKADERLEQVTVQARHVAEAEAARAFTEELARVRAESESAATRALEDEVSRVRAEADARLQAELARVSREAEEVRRAEHATAQAEAERLRQAATREAREVAEAAATRTLEVEIKRVRAEAEAARAAAESRLAEQSKAQADASTHAVAEAERIREAAAREARDIAEAAASRKLEVELQKVRAEADARLREHRDSQVKAEKMRESAARDARRIAEATATRTMETEIARVREEADARLGQELAQLRADAERRRVAELEEIKRQVDEMREAAAQHARSAATEAVAAEIERTAAFRQANAPRTIAVVRAPAPAVAKAAPTAPPPAIAAPAAVETVAEEESPADAPVAASYYDLWRSEGSPVIGPEAYREAARGIPSKFREKRWMLPAAAAVLLVVCGSVAVDTTGLVATAKAAIVSAIPARSNPEPAVAAPVAPPTGNLLVETTPKGAVVTVDGKVRGKTPLTVTELTPGKHKVTLESNDGVVIRREVTIRANERAVTSELMVSGWLTVFSRIPLEVHLGGRRIGNSGDGQITLSPGRHKLTFVNKPWNVRETRTIEIQAGSIASHTVKLPSGSLTIDAPTGAEVWIDGERAGLAPLRGMIVGVGTHDVIVKHPDFGERRETVDVRFGTPATLNISAGGSHPDQSFDGLKVLSESAANPRVQRRSR